MLDPLGPVTTEPRAGRPGLRRIPLDCLLFGVNVPAGMDWSVIGMWHVVFRKSAEPCDPPIVVVPIEGTPFYRVRDGRHRTVAAIMAGRTHIEANVEGV